ncbi:hypothetical protein N7475_001021 [Penicillium sp. IBT 31633x]|nr:hypothetical protein N7475_001021 [Penicillium sp. IBT 31633x]
MVEELWKTGVSTTLGDVKQGKVIDGSKSGTGGVSRLGRHGQEAPGGGAERRIIKIQQSSQQIRALRVPETKDAQRSGQPPGLPMSPSFNAHNKRAKMRRGVMIRTCSSTTCRQ